MKYDPIENLLFKKNRIKFLAKMDSNSIAVFNSNDNYPVSADTTLPFEQHRDLFYLTGVNQEKTVLILATTGSEVNEFLFITKLCCIFRWIICIYPTWSEVSYRINDLL